MPVQYSGLQLGDVISCSLDGKRAHHTAMYVGQMSHGKYGKLHTVAHCDTNGILLQPPGALVEDDPDDESFFVFRCQRPAYGAKAVAYAKEWARFDEDDKSLTQYGNMGAGARSTGVMREDVPPFEYDALYRALKWACRFRGELGDQGEQARMSKSRGTTCCAFVTACYQAGAMNLFAQGIRMRMDLASFYLAMNRGRKNPERLKMVDSPKKTMVNGKIKQGTYNRAQRHLANAGAEDPNSTLKEHFEYVLEILNPNPLVDNSISVEELLTPPMAVDAKFYYSNVMFKKMQTAHNWSYIGRLAFDEEPEHDGYESD